MLRHFHEDPVGDGLPREARPRRPERHWDLSVSFESASTSGEGGGGETRDRDGREAVALGEGAAAMVFIDRIQTCPRKRKSAEKPEGLSARIVRSAAQK